MTLSRIENMNMAYPTKEQLNSVGIVKGAIFKNIGRNRWFKGVGCIVIEVTDVGTVLVQHAQTGEQTYLKATDLDF